MKELQIFKFNGINDVRVVMLENEPWWVLKDVCDILGITNATEVTKRLEKDEVTRFNLGGLSGETNIINEAGLYNVIIRSDKPKAKQFRRWVTHEVLPQIRKTGGYIPVTEKDDDMTILAKGFLIAQKTIENQKRQLEEQAPKVLFANAVSASNTSILVGELSKLLKQNGIEIGQNRLFEWLRNNNYLIKHKGTDYNMPTQYSMELGLFEIKETIINYPDGHISISKTPKVTGKGQIYFVNKFISL